MFEGTNYAFVVELEFEGNREKRFLFSKRVAVNFAEHAAKYTSRESAHHAYKNSDFFNDRVKARYKVYDRNKNELVGTENSVVEELALKARKQLLI